MTIPVRFPGVNRALNVGWISMLLTRSVFPEKFINGSLLAFEEFLRRLRVGEDTTDLLTPEFSKLLYDHLGSTTAPSNLEDGASISSPNDGQITIRDAWLFLGKPSLFAHSLGKFGGLLPFTSIVQTSQQDTPLALQAESGIQLAVDIEIQGDFRFGFKGEEMSERRVAVVRFMSQAFGPKACVSTEDKNRRIFSIRDNIRWSIADIDYVWSSKNTYEH
ncbi:protein of unknown function [Taphrina deformans PYCC 5710]|uniref:Uncharacterized protein n=1 Tax=Taphrina deformans (strain PYCC 5710 / ATCC 11124 / CBS 356.35 / IMI 108563 / JCM 9778 / NBRC 8474) TaxID=1097556 RepID=R4XKG4_TAPDE|nr:protein of unknown function [Taphrina deformans PYCC 5710]|eukprot:CCG84949.1 protein of unknown function [Taphrina deformans PYCC 5710]